MPEIESSSNQGGVGKGIIQSGGNSNADKWIISVMEDGDRKSEAISFKQRKLQKVIQELRNNKEFEGCFDPRVVSIGPYHRGKPELEDAEELKAAVAFNFIKESGRDPKEFYNKFLELVGEAKGYYLDGSTDDYDDDVFAHMMFLDGCFILHFIDVVVNLKGEGLYMLYGILGPGRTSMLLSDLILLENQLPFQVIQALMSIRYKDHEGENMVNFFAGKLYGHETTSKRQGRQDEQPLHFLEQGRQDEQPFHFLGLVRKKYLPHKKDYGYGIDPNSPNKVLRHSFGSATELKAKGIHFKSSSTSCLTDISFTSSFGYGQLTLPPMHFTSKAQTWMAQVLHDHFSSPWTTVAFFAAIFLIILTFTQTYFQVFPRSTNQK